MKIWDAILKLNFKGLGLAFMLAMAGLFNSCGKSVEVNKTSLNYEYSESLNGAECKTGAQSFSDKDDYCRALTDRKLNHGCALSFRKAQYSLECGSTFEETNIIPFEVAGYDSRLRKQCSTGSSGRSSSSPFEKGAQYCSYLRDEGLHQSCFWDDRKTEFERSKCPGEFSNEPKGDPTPPPLAPPPSPPSEGASEKDLVIKELKDAGILVEISSANPPDIGVEPYQVRLKKFWPVLRAMKEEIVSRKQWIAQILVSQYVSYHAGTKVLVVSVDIQESDFKEYFGLFTRRKNLEIKNGFSISSGIDIYGHEENKNQALREKISFLEKNQEALEPFQSAVIKLEIDGSRTAYTFSTRTLVLDEDRYKDELIRVSKLFVEPHRFFAWAEAQSIEVLGDVDVDVFDPSDHFDQVIRDANSVVTSLEYLKKNKKIAKIRFAKTSVMRLSSDGEIRFANREPGLSLNGRVILGIESHVRNSLALAIPIEYPFEFDESYLTGVERLQKYYSAIEGKKGSITSIRFAKHSEYSPDLKILTLGGGDSEDQLKEILKKIP